MTSENTQPNTGLQKICVHAGLAFAFILGIGFFVTTGWIPPISPAANALEIQAIYSEHRIAIRIGVLFAAVFCALCWPFAAAISVQLKRIEGRHAPMAMTQIASASGTVIAIMIAAYAWLALAYRPDSMNPEAAQMFNDFAWLMFVGAFGPALMQNFAIALCILSDKSAQPIYPRWVAYANMYLCITFLPGAILPFVKTGPFAWDGIFGFWIVAVGFFAWILIMWRTTLTAINNQSNDANQ